jgi:DNA polymerase-3 subunit epsilon
MTIFSCFDVETTSLDARKGQVIEIAIVKITHDGELLDEWTTLVGPPPVDIGRPDIHGIDGSWLQGAPNFKEIAGDIVERFDGSIPVAHNAPFDCSFIREEWHRAGLGDLHLEAFDTLPLAKGLGYPGKLVELTDTLGIQLSNAHEALADTRALAAVLIELLKLSKRHVDSPVFQPSLFGPESSGLFEHRPDN